MVQHHMINAYIFMTNVLLYNQISCFVETLQHLLPVRNKITIVVMITTCTCFVLKSKTRISHRFRRVYLLQLHDLNYAIRFLLLSRLLYMFKE